MEMEMIDIEKENIEEKQIVDEKKAEKKSFYFKKLTIGLRYLDLVLLNALRKETGKSYRDIILTGATQYALALGLKLKRHKRYESLKEE